MSKDKRDDSEKRIVKQMKVTPLLTKILTEAMKYAKELHKTYPLDLRFLRRIIRVQVYHAKEMPLYDKDYDEQLTKALEIVNGGNFAKLIEKTKTLKEIEVERLTVERLAVDSLAGDSLADDSLSDGNTDSEKSASKDKQ